MIYYYITYSLCYLCVIKSGSASQTKPMRSPTLLSGPSDLLSLPSSSSSSCLYLTLRGGSDCLFSRSLFTPIVLSSLFANVFAIHMVRSMELLSEKWEKKQGMKLNGYQRLCLCVFRHMLVLMTALFSYALVYVTTGFVPMGYPTQSEPNLLGS